MPSSPTPGTPTSICSRTSMPTWPSPFDHRLGTPEIPAIRFARGTDFVASLVRFRYGLPGCSPPCTDRTGSPQPSGTFTTRLSTDWSPSPLLVMTTTVTGLLLLAGLSPAGMAASLAARSITAGTCQTASQIAVLHPPAGSLTINRSCHVTGSITYSVCYDLNNVGTPDCVNYQQSYQATLSLWRSGDGTRLSGTALSSCTGYGCGGPWIGPMEFIDGQ